MTKKKQTLIGVGIALTLILMIAIIIGVISYRNYHATYIVIDDVEYLRASTSLDLSGKSITELEKLPELTQLQELDLQDTGLTEAQYLDLQAALPNCRIIWSVPFQDGYCPSDLTELTVATLHEDDFAVLGYLPDLVSVNADGCQDYEVLMKLAEQHPELKISYMVHFSSQSVHNNVTQLDLTDPVAEELMTGLQYLPDVTNVNLQGTLPEVEELIVLQQAYPGVQFYWEFELLGVPVNTLTEFIDLSNVKMEDTVELERYIPCFYNLAQVDMVSCGIANEEMAALNERYPDTKFVWKVAVYGTYVRTDITWFMPVKLHLAGGSLTNLKYCTDMVVMDFGHYGITDISYVEYMPNLKYFLACESDIKDISPLANCTSLEYLELADSPIYDLWPLTNLTNLKDLNLAGTPHKEDYGPVTFHDHTPLLQMTWLDRLWLPHCKLGSERREEIRAALPDTELVFYSTGNTTSGFRHTPRYYAQRDLLGMRYYTN